MSGSLRPSVAESQEVIDQVPSDEVGRVTQDFRDSGAAEVRVETNSNGTFKIIALFRS
jgi:hypothetical protein